MKIAFNNIPFIKKVNVAMTTPTFCAKKSNSDEFVKSSEPEQDYSDTYADILNSDIFNDEAYEGIPENILQRAKEEYVFSAFLSALSQKNVARSLRQNNPKEPIAHYVDTICSNRQVAELLLNTFSKANITNAGELGRIVEIYNQPKVKSVFKKATIDFFEVFGLLKTKNDILLCPELLLYFKDSGEGKTDEQLQQIYQDCSDFLKELSVDSLEEFDEKFYYLASDFNNFETVTDHCEAFLHILKSYDEKIDLLSPIAEKFKTQNKLNNPEKVYATIPEIVDILFEQNDGKNLGDLEDYINLAVSNRDFKNKQLSYVRPYFNDFDDPTDDLRFYRLLNENNITVDNFNKMYGKMAISDIEPMSLIFNMPNIISLVAEKDGMNQISAKDLYVKFADILNVAYASDNSSVDILSDTFDLIKNCKFKESEDILNFYNQCNLPNKKSKSISSSEFVEFIDLMRFVNRADFKDSKKIRAIRLDNLRKLRDDYNSVKEPIESFLQSESKNLFLEETSLSIFNKYGKDLVGLSDEELSSKLYVLDKFNIKNIDEYNRKNLEMEKFEAFFPSRKELATFIIKNRISFDNLKDDEEYKQNTQRILNLLFDKDNKEESFELIKKLSYSRFLSRSKNSLTNFFTHGLSSLDNKKLLVTLLDKKVKSYTAFESFVKKYEVDKKSYSKLANYLSTLPEGVCFNDLLTKLDAFEDLLVNSNFPITLNANNISNLSYDDLVNSTIADNKLNPKVLSKLLKLPENTSPVFVLPKAFVSDNSTDKSKIATELFMVKSDSDNYPKIINLLYGHEVPENLSRAELKKFSYFIPDSFVDFVNSMSKTDRGNHYNISLHAKLRIIERFLMDDIKEYSDIFKLETQQKIDDLLNSIYNQEQLLIKKSGDGKRILLNSIYDDKVIESVFSKSGMLITTVERSH